MPADPTTLPLSLPAIAARHAAASPRGRNSRVWTRADLGFVIYAWDDVGCLLAEVERLKAETARLAGDNARLAAEVARLAAPGATRFDDRDLAAEWGDVL